MGCTGSKELTLEEIIRGLKSALGVATRETVRQLSAAGGFENDESVHIKIPGDIGEILEKAKDLPGIGKKITEFEKTMNQAAEKAAGAAAEVFRDAINGMNFNDAKAILNGADNAATGYFRESCGAALLEKFSPIVRAKMDELGVVVVLDAILSAYYTAQEAADAAAEAADAAKNAIGGAFNALTGGDDQPKVEKKKEERKEFDCAGYVTNEAFEAMFKVLAEYEKKVRHSTSLHGDDADLKACFPAKKQQ